MDPVNDPMTRPRRASAGLAANLLAVGTTIAIVALVAACGPTPAAPSPAGAGRVTAAPTELPLVTVGPVTDASSAPATSSPSATPAATAAAEVRAERIRIERLGIDLRIIEGDGIDAPIGKAAHYPGTAWPGGGSNIFIYGHAREGMFIALWDVRQGDEVVLDLVDGTSRTYVVKKVRPRVAWDAVEYLEPTATEQLTLQTSTSYQPTAPRFIAIAVPKP